MVYCILHPVGSCVIYHLASSWSWLLRFYHHERRVEGDWRGEREGGGVLMTGNSEGVASRAKKLNSLVHYAYGTVGVERRKMAPDVSVIGFSTRAGVRTDQPGSVHPTPTKFKLGGIVSCTGRGRNYMYSSFGADSIQARRRYDMCAKITERAVWTHIVYIKSRSYFVRPHRQHMGDR